MLFARRRKKLDQSPDAVALDDQYLSSFMHCLRFYWKCPGLGLAVTPKLPDEWWSRQDYRLSESSAVLPQQQAWTISPAHDALWRPMLSVRDKLFFILRTAPTGVRTWGASERVTSWRTIGLGQRWPWAMVAFRGGAEWTH